MSFLNVPRFCFSGQFIADPSTVNNRPQNYKLGETIPPAEQGWNPNGTGAWGITECKITSVTLQDGTFSKSAEDDPLIGSAFASGSTSGLSSARLVDLDTDQQMVSEVWALNLQLGDGNSNSFQAAFKQAGFMDIWFSAGPGGQAGARAWYQSVLTDISWSENIDSPVLNQLRQASGDKLSIKFMVDRYNAHNPELGNAPQNFPDPGNGMEFTHGRIVGSIGVVNENEPDHFVAGRLLRNLSSEASFAPCLYDCQRQKVVLDLGNSLKAGHLVDPAMLDIGTLQLVLLNGDSTPPVLGEIDYLSEDWYPTTAGIVEFPADSVADQIESFPLGVVISGNSPQGVQPNTTLLRENSDGSFVRPDQFVFRLNPGDYSESVTFYATEFGKPVVGKKISLGLVPQPGLNEPASALPLSGTEPTDENGSVSFQWKPQDPGQPRSSGLDGQVYFVGCALEGADDEIPDPNLFVSAHVYTEFPDVPNPTWHDDIHDILALYQQLYPVMGFIKLGNYEAVKQNAGRIQMVMNKPLTDGGHMPVTRDMSKSRLDVINRWFEQGMPEGNA